MPGTAVCETDDAASTAMMNSAEQISPAPEHAPTPAPAPRDLFVETLAQREEYRDAYWQRDGIADDRLLWRAQSFRHLTHPLPGQTILELGCGNNRFTRPLHKV